MMAEELPRNRQEMIDYVEGKDRVRPVVHQLELEIVTDDGPVAVEQTLARLQRRLDSVWIVREHDPYGHWGTSAWPTWTFRGTRNDLMILAIRWLAMDESGRLHDDVLYGQDVESVLDSIREVSP